MAIQGPQGTIGPTGLQGTDGEAGPQGVQGDFGTPGGPQGFQGFQGSQGPQGFQGHQGGGAQGAQGRQGYQGFQGVQGSQGIQGAQGFQGIQGSQGIQGVQGTQGAPGSQGSQGTPGGATGPQGAPGAQGPQGAQGAQGASAAGGFTAVWPWTNAYLNATGKAYDYAGTFGGSFTEGAMGIQSNHVAGSNNLLAPHAAVTENVWDLSPTFETLNPFSSSVATGANLVGYWLMGGGQIAPGTAGDPPTLTAKHMGFMTYPAVPKSYASSANGTTQTTTNIFSTWQGNDVSAQFRAVYETGVNIKFYVGTTLVATHTTNLPTGALLNGTPWQFGSQSGVGGGGNAGRANIGPTSIMLKY